MHTIHHPLCFLNHESRSQHQPIGQLSRLVIPFRYRLRVYVHDLNLWQSFLHWPIKFSKTVVALMTFLLDIVSFLRQGSGLHKSLAIWFGMSDHL